MKIRFIQNAIDRLRGKKHLAVPAPYYNDRIPLPPEYPDIYNADGRKMEVFFIRDRRFSREPYGTFPPYFLWGSFNWGLSTHFYTGRSAKETVGAAASKSALSLIPI